MRIILAVLVLAALAGCQKKDYDFYPEEYRVRVASPTGVDTLTVDCIWEGRNTMVFYLDGERVARYSGTFNYRRIK